VLEGGLFFLRLEPCAVQVRVGIASIRSRSSSCSFIFRSRWSRMAIEEGSSWSLATTCSAVTPYDCRRFADNSLTMISSSACAILAPVSSGPSQSRVPALGWMN